MEIEKQDYFLSESFFLHSKAVRAIDVNKDFMITGSIDKTVQIFRRAEDSEKFIHVSKIDMFDDYIYCVKIEEKSKGFFVGCKDTKIYLLDLMGNPDGVLEGHQGAVNSLSQCGDYLVSGSWDTNAKIWDISTRTCIKTLEGHTHSVSVLFVNPSFIITASIDKNIYFWENGIKTKTITGAHSDGIRHLDLDKNLGFLSASNDETAKLWTLTGETLNTFKGHESYVYCIKSNNSGLFFTSSEDRSLKIFSQTSLIQTIPHPNTIWALCFDLLTSDIVTACADGGVRIFTKDHKKMADEAEIKEFEKNCLEGAANEGGQGLSRGELEKLVKVEEKGRVEGKNDGEIRLFRNGDLAEAFLWKASERTWEKIGDVISGNAQKIYDGDQYFEKGEYDYIFDVDYDGLPKKLPFNEGGNVLEAADKFLAREGLGRAYVEQISNFIKNNTRGTAQQKKPQAKPKKEESHFESKYFPMNKFVLFENMNLQGLKKKVIEFNDKIEETMHLKGMNEKERKYFDNIIDLLSKPNTYHTTFLSNFELDLISQKFLKWPQEYLLPIYDLLRIFLLHPQSEFFFSGLSAGLSILTDICNVIHKNTSDVFTTLCLKLFCNMFGQITSQNSMLNNAVLIFDAMEKLCKEKMSANTENALSCLILNYCISLALSFSIEDQNFEKFIGILSNRLSNENNNGNLFKILVGLGNLMISKRENYTNKLHQELEQVVKRIEKNEQSDGDIANCLIELKEFF